MGYRQSYRCGFKNFEQQDVEVLIEDILSGDPNPYNVAVDTIIMGGGDLLVRVFFAAPPGATAVTIGYSSDGGATWTNVTGDTVSPREITIPDGPQYIYRVTFNYADPSQDETYYLDQLEGIVDELTPGGDPLRLVTNNNGADKLATVYGLQLVMTFNSTASLNLNKLLQGIYSDRRYKVTAWINDRPIFRGYLNIADTTEPFLPHPNRIVLSATCGLMSLKSKTLKDFNGANPTGKNKIIDYLAWCFAQTGIEENINVVMNIREETQGTITADPTGHIYNTEYLDAKTFEAEVGESEDCLTVLQKILKHTCFSGQRHGEWWIKNVDEFDNQPDYVFVYTPDGTLDNYDTDGREYKKYIGLDRDMKLSDEAAFVGFQSPAKFIKDTYRYETPKEVPCNVNFERGDYISDISANEKKYEIECWTLYQDRPNVLSTTAEAFIYRRFENNYEKERYAIIGVASSLIEQQLASEFIPVQQKGLFDLRFAVKYNGQVETSSGTVTGQYAQARLYASDGTYYTLDGGLDGNSTPAWAQCTADFNTNQKYFRIQFDGTEDDTEWRNVGFQNGDCPPIPKDGDLQIVFCHQLKVNQFELHIGSLQFEYIPYINGNYQKYTGQHHKVEDTTQDNNNKVDEQVYISDAPLSLLKGALHRWNGSKYVLSGRYWNSSVYISGPPDSSVLHPFGYIQAFNVWNQYNLPFRIMRGNVEGIESDSVDENNKCDIPSIFHTYFFTDADPHTNNKKWMLLSYNMDLYRCRIDSGVWVQVHDEVTGKSYDESHEFKYTTR